MSATFSAASVASIRKLLRVPDAVEIPSTVTEPAAQLRFLAGQVDLLPTDRVGAARTAQWLGTYI